MDILCLMGLFPKEYEKTIIEDSIGGIQNAANKFQWGIVKGLGTIDEIEYKIINSLYYLSFFIASSPFSFSFNNNQKNHHQIKKKIKKKNR